MGKRARSKKGQAEKKTFKIAGTMPSVTGDLIDYATLLDTDKKAEDRVLQELAVLTMAARVKFESGDKGGKKVISIEPKSDKAIVSFTLSAKNFAAVRLKIDDIITTVPRAFEAAPGEESTGFPSKHAERYALTDAINQAIDKGWKPMYNGELLEKLSCPTDPEELEKFGDALKDTEVTLFTEKSFCVTGEDKLPPGENNCADVLKLLLSGKKHKVYYAVIGNSEDEQIKLARKIYYLNDKYQEQKKFLNENLAAVQEARNNPKKKSVVDGAKKNRILSSVSELQQSSTKISEVSTKKAKRNTEDTTGQFPIAQQEEHSRQIKKRKQQSKIKSSDLVQKLGEAQKSFQRKEIEPIQKMSSVQFSDSAKFKKSQLEKLSTPISKKKKPKSIT